MGTTLLARFHLLVVSTTVRNGHYIQGKW